MTELARILVVDARPDLRERAVSLLSRRGCRVESAITAEQALQAIRSVPPPDLVLLHRELPGGVEVRHQLRNSPTCASTLLVIVSDDEAEPSDEAGNADGYISRPVSDRELLARVEPFVRIASLNLALAMRDRAINAASEGICITLPEPSGPVFNWVSQGFEQITGYPAGHVLGRNLSLLNGPETSKEALERLDALVRKQEAGTVELLNYRQDGSSFWNRLSVTPVRSDGGQMTHFVVILHDITWQKETEFALRTGEARLREAQVLGMMGDWEYHVRTQQVNWSEGIFRLYQRDPALGQPTFQEAMDALFPESVDELGRCLEHSAATGEGFEIELHVRLPGGRDAFHYCAGRTFRDDQGNVTRMFGVAQDITARKRSEEAVRRNEHRLREAQSAGSIGDWEFDPQTGQISWSEELYRLAGRDIHAGPPTLEENLAWYFPEDASRLRACVNRAIETGQGYQLDLHLRLPDGRDAWHYAIGRATRDRTGKVIRLHGIAQDVTERKRAEERIRQLNRVYAVLSNINHAIVRVRDRQTLYQEACRIAVEDGQFLGAWIGVLDPATEEVRVAAKAGDWDLEGIRITSRPTPDGCRQTVTALREDRHAVCNDIENDPDFGTLREAALARGFRSVAVFPLKIGGQPLGVFSLYAEVPEFFDASELRLLDGLASDISFATEFLEQEERRKLAEQARAESDARFSSAFQYASVGMALVAPDGRWLKVNGAACALLGYSRDELLTRTFQELTHPDDLDADLEFVRRMLAGEITTYQIEKRYLHRSGHTVRTLLSVSLVRGEGGAPLYFIAQIQDITDQKLAMEALRSSEERYRKLADNFPAGTVNTYDRNLKITFVGGADLKKFGATPDMFIGRHFREVAPPETWQIAEPYLARAFQGETGVYEAPFHDERFYRVIVAPLFALDGTVDEILVVSQNITETRQTEVALRRREQEQREIARQLELERARLIEAQAVARVGSWETDLNTLEVSWSDQTHCIFGTDPRTFQPTHPLFLAMVHPEDRRAVDEAFRASASRQSACSVEHRILLPNGQVRWVEERWRVHRNEAGDPVRATGTCLDITERVQAADEIRTAHQQLAWHVENTPLAVIEWDADFRVHRWSQQAEELFGWRAGEVIGRKADEWPFVHPEDVAHVAKVMASLVDGTSPRNVSLNRNCTRDGGTVFCEWYNSAMLGRDGRLISILSLVLDMTARKKGEEALIRSQQQLRALSARLETLREEERTRISREIHDELGQMLTGIKMDLRWMENRLGQFTEDRRLNPILDKLVATAELTDLTVETVQRIAAELRPGILDKLGLPVALQYEATRFVDRTGIPCSVTAPAETPGMRPEIATAFFRIFQEALTNVIRHAGATVVEVELRPEFGGYRLEIRDDGRGIRSCDLLHATSLGLLGIQERATLLGGGASFIARPEGGTNVSVWIPGHPSPAETQ